MAAAVTIAKPGSLASLHFHSHLKQFPLLDSSSIRLSSRHSRFCQIKHTTNSSNLPLIRAQTSPDYYFPDSKFYKVEAILRPWRVQHVSSALLKMGIRGVTVSDVRGFGAQGGSTERHGGSEFSEDKFVAKVKMESVVAKEQVEAVIDKIIVEARTGEIGDGKIFLVPVSDVIRVRTGERGEEAERMTGGRSDIHSAQAAFVLNRSRRFRYTLNHKKDEEQQQILRKIRAHAQARQMFLWEAWQDLTLIILMIAAVASLALGIKSEGIKEGWYDGGSIAFAVILVIVVTAISDYRQFLLFQNLKYETRKIHLKVIRGGRRVDVSIYDLVVGDVVPLNIGDQVPADGVVISGHSLSIDESIMTGESMIVHKDPKNPFLMSGCKVADGSGTMLVTGVGVNTEWGLHMVNISVDTGEETPLQVRLNGVATFIGIVGLAVAFIVLVVLLARFFTGHTKNPDGSVPFTPGKTKVGDAVDGAIKILTVAVTIVVVAVPEGLPLVVTLTLANSMRKMMADKALVRRLSACEKMGSATTICCDKTGTLTLNQMTVVEAYAGEEKIDPSDSNSQLSPMLSSLLIEGIAQNSNSSVYVPAGGGDVELSGSPTEKAILKWGIQLGMNFEAARSESSIIRVFPFNPEKKRGGVAVKLPNSEVHIHWKGAAEIVLASCKAYIDTNDQLVAMDEYKATNFKNKIDDMATCSLRCVAIAYRSYMEKVSDNEEDLSQWVLPDNDLVLLAIVGIKDHCRPSVKDAVRMCQIAGVKVRMVTGDNIQTARAIALECGILTSEADASESNIIEGKEFRELPDPEREERAEKISVMGRSSPNDRLLLVEALRKRGHVVAAVDNDAPALREADIGLAKGILGTEVAKESSDIIILDDSFASVVKVVRWGRSAYANIQKFIQFQLTVNVAALVINFVAAVSSGDVPLNVVQFLWVNLIMDTLGALALATEPPTDHQMQRPPVVRSVMLLIIHVLMQSCMYSREPLITNIAWGDRLMQLLWVTLIIDFLGSLTMAIERQTDHQLHRPPVGQRDNHVPVQSCMYSREPLITNIMWRNLLIQAIYQSSVLLVLNFNGKSLLNLEHDTSDHANKVKNTLIFNSFSMCQIFNEFNARKPDEKNIFIGITKNRLFMGIVALTVVLQILIIEFLGTVRLNWKHWMISVVIGFIGEEEDDDGDEQEGEMKNTKKEPEIENEIQVHLLASLLF
ncbi:hypothetical protein LWI29_034536 [Acer saccharum]|uniref:Calcium-transporting ATPase n=1 Tax=Acer saccharum TaxID=4024 RepID=A0AA39SPK2_ACESA|nr:hypothetical protein LWI29_034536 [Acer saccharum]